MGQGNAFVILIVTFILATLALGLLFFKTKETFVINGQVFVHNSGEGGVTFDMGDGVVYEDDPGFNARVSTTPVPPEPTSKAPPPTQTDILPPVPLPPILTAQPKPQPSTVTLSPATFLPIITTSAPPIQTLMPSLVPNYMYTAKNRKVYMGNTEVDINGISWAGLNYSTNIDSLQTGTIDEHIAILKANNFNAVRLPMSARMMLSMDNLKVENASDSINPGVKGTNAGVHVDALIRSLSNAGILVMINLHRFTGFGSNEEDIGPLWYSEQYSEERVTEAWVKIAKRYIDKPNVFAMDIKNEPHGSNGIEAKWGGSDPRTDWASACERIGNAILKVNPNVLITVEGVTDQVWGDSIAGGLERPIKLDVPNKVVYSPHFYKHWNYPSKDGFSMTTYLDRVLGKMADSSATIVIGEYGFDHTKPDEVSWVKDLASYLKTKGVNNAFYWALNENEGVGASILARGTTVVVPQKLAVIASISPKATKLLFP